MEDVWFYTNAGLSAEGRVCQLPYFKLPGGKETFRVFSKNVLHVSVGFCNALASYCLACFD